MSASGAYVGFNSAWGYWVNAWMGNFFPKSRGAMHLDTVFSFCDVDLVTTFPEMVAAIRVHSLRPGERDVRPQHAHQHPAEQGRRRGDHDLGIRTGPWPRWQPPHVVPDRARSTLTSDHDEASP